MKTPQAPTLYIIAGIFKSAVVHLLELPWQAYFITALPIALGIILALIGIFERRE